MGLFRDRTTADDRVEARREAELEREDARARAADAEATEAERVEAREAAAVDRDRDVHDRRYRDEVVAERPVHPIAATRDRFGGIDVPASLVGMLAALAMVTLLGGIAGAAIGAYGYQTGLGGEDLEEVTIGGFVVALAVLFVAYLVGGWAAGRIARYDGARNGFMTAVWTILLAAVLSATAAIIGDRYDVFANVNLPQWFDRDALTLGALISGAAAIAAMVVGGILGGLWGTRYHRIADETLLDANELRGVRAP